MSLFSNKVIFLWLFTLVPKILCNRNFPLNTSVPTLQNDFPTKCMGDLGCFETGPPFYHPVLRPLLLLPFDEEYIPTNFSLFTRRNPSEPELIDHDYESIVHSSFSPYCFTKIIIHGFTVTPEKNDAYDIMKNTILARAPYNVILVDWSKSNNSPYFQAVSNARVVGAQLARLIQALQHYKGANPQHFHIIGHSLGAAIAGWAGERIPRLGRITGLDPAGMYFYQGDPSTRLDTTDAEFVDVIITNGGLSYAEGIGTLEPIGHVNFYPNGGNTQPGCYDPTKPFEEFDHIRNLCSHMRALELFIASIFNERCQFWGTACENYDLYTSGQCNEMSWWKKLHFSSFCGKIEMGFHAEKSYFPIGQTFFLETSPDSPYCIPPKPFTYRNRYSTKL